MNITLNGAPREFPADITVAALLASLERREPALAVAVNLHVVPRSEFEVRVLRDGDRVDIVTAVGGG